MKTATKKPASVNAGFMCPCGRLVRGAGALGRRYLSLSLSLCCDGSFDRDGINFTQQERRPLHYKVAYVVQLLAPRQGSKGGHSIAIILVHVVEVNSKGCMYQVLEKP